MSLLGQPTILVFFVRWSKTGYSNFPSNTNTNRKIQNTNS